MTTVGYGNISPTSQSSRLFTIFYLLFGISLITLVVSGIIEFLVIKGIQVQYDRDRTRIARRGKQIALHKQKRLSTASHECIEEYLDNAVEDKRWIDTGIDGWKRVAAYVKHNPFGKWFCETIPLIIIFAVGALTVGLVEGWSWIDSTYFSVVSITTVGKSTNK